MSKDLENNDNSINPATSGIAASKDDPQQKVDEVEVSKELSKVASNQKRDIVILGVVALVFAYIAYQAFVMSNASSAAQQQASGQRHPTPVARPQEVIKPVAENTKSNVPALPELPKMETPKIIEQPKTERKEEHIAKKEEITPTTPQTQFSPASPLISIPLNNSTPPLAPTTNVDAQKRVQAKRKSGIFLVSGQQSGKTEKEIEMMNDFKYRGDLSYVLGKGKIIEAVIGTTINTDFVGEVVAVVARDVYSENGKVLLIPKGSRVFGKASSGTGGAASGYGRIDIAWNRIDLPSGYSLNLSGDTIDNLGRKGVHGRLDNKYKEQITNTILSSTVSILTAAALDKVIPPVATSGTSATQTALANSVTATMNSINTNATYADGKAKIQAICAQIPAISGIATSSISASITAACNTAITAAATAVAPDNGQIALGTLMSAITTAVSGLNVSIANNSTPSQQQAASQQAFKDITAKVGELLTNTDTLSPTITLNQGESVKIYVNKDYTFPKSALNKSRFVQ